MTSWLVLGTGYRTIFFGGKPQRPGYTVSRLHCGYTRKARVSQAETVKGPPELATVHNGPEYQQKRALLPLLCKMYRKSTHIRQAEISPFGVWKESAKVDSALGILQAQEILVQPELLIQVLSISKSYCT